MMKNDSAASGQGILKGFSLKSRGQRDAGPEWQMFSLSVKCYLDQMSFRLLALRLVATGYETDWGESGQGMLWQVVGNRGHFFLLKSGFSRASSSCTLLRS